MYVIKSIELKIYPLQDYSGSNKHSPEPSFDIKESMSYDSSIYFLALLSLTKEFVSSNPEEIDIPFAGIDGPMDSIKTIKYTFSQKTLSNVIVGINGLTEINQIPNIKHGTVIVNNETLGFSYIDYFYELDSVFAIYNTPLGEYQRFYSNKRITFPFILTKNEVDFIIKGEHKNFITTTNDSIEIIVLE